MKNYEVPFKNAKKDRDGYATILVNFGEYNVPVKGKPLPITKDETTPTLKEIKRINLTCWNLKDIPEIAKIVGDLCGCDEGITTLLYWNGYDCVWKLWSDDENLPEPEIENDDDDEVMDLLDEKIEKLENNLYEPHDTDNYGNFGDPDVHCVYLGNSDVKLFENSIQPSDDELLQDDPKHLKANAISIVNNARNKHQKIPYAKIGEALRCMTDEELGKIFVNG